MQVGTKSVGKRKDERAVKNRQKIIYLQQAGKLHEVQKSFKINSFLSIDPYYSCFPEMCQEKEESPPCETIQRGKYRTEEKCLLYIQLCFLYSDMETQIIYPPYNQQFVILVSFGVEKHGIS